MWAILLADTPVMAITAWASNAELIADCARLGYLRSDWRTLDPTWGKGTFWKLWRPTRLIGSDILPSPGGFVGGVDFTNLPWTDRFFDAVVFDPPYKMNGTPTAEVDERYGVDVVRTWQQRLTLIGDGVKECARVLGDGYLLVKCQDQVVSGKKRWQTTLVQEWAEAAGLGLVDRLDMLGGRAQPDGVRQVHARGSSSTMLVFKRGHSWRPA